MAQPRPGNQRSPKKNVVVTTKGKKGPVAKASSGKSSKRINAQCLPDIPSSRLGVWRLNTRSQHLNWSAGCARLFGIKDPTLLPTDLRTLLLHIHRDDRAKFREALTDAAKKNTEFHSEVRILTPDNSYRWIEFSGEIRSSRPGIMWNGLIQDITIKKLTEFELFDWKTRNELVSESAGLLIYDYDVATGEIIWSGNTVQLVGYTSMEMGRIELWAELIHPDDRDEANRILEEARETLKPYDVYYRFRRKNGGYCYVHDRGQFVTDRHGEAVRMLGVMNDVSERIAADRTIKQSEKSYRELFNSVGEAIYIQKADGTFVDVNKTACDIYGYSKDELLGKNPGFIASPGKNDFDDLRRKMEQALSGKTQTFLWWGLTKAGANIITEVRLTKGTYFGDDCIIATSWDITEKIAAEMSLQESEKRFRRLVQDLNVGVLLQDADGEIQMANTAALELLGIAERSLLNKTFGDTQWKFFTEKGEVMNPEDHPWKIAESTGTAMRGTVVGVQRRTEEDIVWALVNVEPVLLVDKKLLHLIITLTDITERKKVEEDLKESELRFRTLQEASFGGIGLHSKGTIIDCNQGLCDITGYSYNELIGSNGLDLIAPEYRDLVYQKIINRVEQPYDVEGVRKDGSRYYLEIHGKNIPYQEGLLRVTEFRDITDRKAAESKILEQNAKLLSITEDLKNRNEQLREFTQIVSHNLRSPVGNILSLLNFVENAESEEERGEYISLLKEAGATTLTTLQELNEVLQIKQNKNIEKQRLEFEQVFSNVRRMLVAKIVETGAEIVTDFSASSIEYPNIYLESIFLNLLSNALKYHHPDRKPMIMMRTFKSGDSISMSITDNGRGINMQRYGHQVFKLRKTFHKHPESRGIGLFMIRNQVEAMGGDISVSSVENEGTTFLVNFTGKIREDEY